VDDGLAETLAERYPFGYHRAMAVGNVLEQARDATGLSQAALAARAGTSRPTLSAYEHGRKSPTLDTAARIVGEAGFDLSITPRIEFRQVAVDRGRPIRVPGVLPRLPLDRAFATVKLPLHLNWSDRGRRYDLRDRRQRARVYELVLREGGPDDVLTYVDGALLVDLWDDLILPAKVRVAWDGVVTRQHDERVA
jgi:transcriptional regulator with XRE-family HTH domain